MNDHSDFVPFELHEIRDLDKYLKKKSVARVVRNLTFSCYVAYRIFLPETNFKTKREFYDQFFNRFFQHKLKARIKFLNDYSTKRYLVRYTAPLDDVPYDN
jgi:hypothetical protein